MRHHKKPYPKLYYPNQIAALLKETPLLPQKPSLPQKPITPKNTRKHNSGGNSGCLGVAGLASIIFFIVSVTAEEVNLQMALSSIVYFLVCLLLFKITAQEKDSHKKKKKNEYAQAIKQHSILLEKYDKELAAYKEKMQIYLSQKDVLLSESNIEKYRAKNITDYLSNSYKAPIFEECKERDIVKKSAAKEFFAKKLKDSTSWRILTEQKIPRGTGFVYPDIIIDINGIYINVEIEEPHDDNDRTFIDKERDDYMTNSGWFITRFAEDQVSSYANECIEYIEKVIGSIFEGKGEITAPVFG